MKDELIERLGASSAVEMKFRISRKKYKDHIFFEGKTDKLFYMQMMERCGFDTLDYAIYECGSRINVISSLVNLPRRDDESFMFFVDRDTIAPDVVSSDMYVTGKYSFESYIVSEGPFVKFVKRNCGVTTNEDLNRFVSMFNNFLRTAEKFLRRVANLKEYKLRTHSPIKWDKIDLVHFSEISLEGLVKGKSERCATAFFRDGLDIDIYKKGWVENRSQGRGKFVYGKGLMKIFVAFIDKICDLAAREGRDPIRIKDKSPDNITMIFAPLCQVPEDLEIFLKRKRKLPEAISA